VCIRLGAYLVYPYSSLCRAPRSCDHVILCGEGGGRRAAAGLGQLSQRVTHGRHAYGRVWPMVVCHVCRASPVVVVVVMVVYIKKNVFGIGIGIGDISLHLYNNCEMVFVILWRAGVRCVACTWYVAWARVWRATNKDNDSDYYIREVACVLCEVWV